MELKINIGDRDEIAAALPLLQLILDNTPAKACGGECHSATATHTVAEVFPDASRLGVTAAPVFGAIPEAPPAGPSIAELQAAGALVSLTVPADPAAVFGGAQPAAPLAPSTPPAAGPATVVPPPPMNSAPTTPTPGPVSSDAGAGSVELDKNGLPWDGRIHASTKRKNADGSWTAKRGVNAGLITQVEAELRAQVAQVPAPGVAAAPAPLPIPTAVPANNGLTPGSAGLPSSPVTPAAPGGESPDTAQSAPATFEQLMPRITAAVTAGLMPPTAVGAACAAQGVASVVTLQQSPQFVPLVWAALKQQYPGI